MTSTIDLLTKALRMQPAKYWCDRYDINQSTLSTAKKRGHLSPVMAGNFAIDLGEDARHWMTIAAMETERESPLLERLKSSLALHNP